MLLKHVSTELEIYVAQQSKIEGNEQSTTEDQILELDEMLDLNKDALLVQILSEKHSMK